MRRIASEGSDMSRPMDIDFFVDVPDLETGQRVAAAAETLGFRAQLSQDEESGVWTCACSKSMLATYEGVLSAQGELEDLASSFPGCTADGWGTFGNAEPDGSLENDR